MPIDDAVASALNDQIHLELESAYVYLGIAAWCEEQDLPGFAHWMRIQAREELDHAQRIIGHVHDRGGSVDLRSLAAPPDGYSSVHAAVAAALAHEQRVTGSIHALHRLATERGDLAALPVLQWFIAEQVEEEKTASDLLARLGLVEKGMGSLLMLDRELSERKAE